MAKERGTAPVAVASTGVRELDSALGGLYWGDNVVWEQDAPDAAEPFYRAVARTAPSYAWAAFVAVERDPAELKGAYPELEVVAAGPGTDLAQPRALLNEIRRRARPDQGDLLLFDSLDAMAASWGEEAARAFFTNCCPMLLDVGAIAYWSLTPSAHPPRLRKEVEAVTQCVLSLADGRLRVTKAEGRPPRTQGSVFRIGGDGAGLEPAPAAARLGAALRAVRLQRGLNQSEIARLAGVSPSAVSQAERGQRGLSLETLLELTDKLQITLDDLLQGEAAPGYRLARRHEAPTSTSEAPLALLDDPAAGLRAYLVRIPPRGRGAPPFAHKGAELVAVADGLVQCVLDGGRPVLRSGEALLAERSTVASWRNLSDREAALFWIVRD
jgi:transcriptional regulator with XRE-family HTH domain